MKEVVAKDGKSPVEGEVLAGEPEIVTVAIGLPRAMVVGASEIRPTRVWRLILMRWQIQRRAPLKCQG
jgi:hypothetical protein